MRTNRIYGLCMAIAFVACIGANGCKKSSGGSQPVVDNTITYDLSFSIYPNPERGFIHTYPVYTGGASLNLPELKLQKGQNISLLLSRY